jgi:branched-chain amino acid transport system substrate-binding protein
MLAVFRICSVAIALLLSSTSVAQDTTAIGVILPLTGAGAFWGENSKRGIELAIKDLHPDLQQRRVRFIFEDDHCSAKDALAAFRKLVDIDRARIILGPVCSSAAAAVAPLAEKAGVPMIAFAESDEVKTGRYVRRLWVPNSFQGQRLARYAREINVRSTAILATQNAYGKTLSEAFAAQFVKLGGQVVAHAEYDPSTTTFRSELTKLKASQPEALFFASYISDGAILVREARALGISVPLLGSSTLHSADFLNSAGSAADGLVIADLLDSSSAALRERWESTFRSPYPGIQSGGPLFYDTAVLLAEYLRTHDAQGIPDYLRALRYQGVSGTIQFTNEGNLDRDHAILRVEDGEFQQVAR